MKSQLFKFALPVGMGLSLLIITLFGIISTTLVGCEDLFGQKKCEAGALLGSDGKCYGPCESGSTATYTPVGNCSAASAGGVYCCIGGGGGGGCIPTGCSSSTPWLGCGKCFATSDDCLHRGTSTLSDDCNSCRKCP